MRNYIIRRVLLVIPTLILVSIIVFFSIRLVPGNVVDMLAAEIEEYTQLDVEAIRHALGLDVPIVTQYGRWVGVLPGPDGTISGILQGNLGVSLWESTSVTKSILSGAPVTLELAILALTTSILIAIPIGVYSALRQDTWGDYVARSFAILCIAVPGFWLATMVIVFPSIWWGHMPSIMLIPFVEDPIGNLKMFIVPAIVLGMLTSGMITRMTRTMMLEVLRQDYVRTAWAKGLAERVVVMRHTLKNALIPVITIIGTHLGTMIGGTVVIEQIFCLPGIGRLLVHAITFRDYPIVSGVLLFFSVFLVLINLAVDISYAYLDPRVQYK